MHYLFFLSISVFITATLCAETPQQPAAIFHQPTTVNLTINAAPTMNCNQTQSTANSLSQDVQVAVSQQVKQFVEQIQQTTQSTWLQTQAWCGSWYEQHKRSLVVGTLLGAYTALCYTTIKGNHYLANTNLWSLWQSNLTLDALLETPHKDISAKLLREIQHRYTNPQNPADFISPLVNFLQMIDHELVALRHYEKIKIWVDRLYLTRVTPYDRTSYASIPERIKRLLHLKNLFLAWMTDYKMAQNEHVRSAFKKVMEAQNQKANNSLWAKLTSFTFFKQRSS